MINHDQPLDGPLDGPWNFGLPVFFLTHAGKDSTFNTDFTKIGFLTGDLKDE
jgi:hypothetical protein